VNSTVLIDGKSLSGDVVLNRIQNLKAVQQQGQVAKAIHCKAFFPCSVSAEDLIKFTLCLLHCLVSLYSLCYNS